MCTADLPRVEDTMPSGPSNPREAQLTMVFSGAGMPSGGVCTLGLVKAIDPFTQTDLEQLGPITGDLHEALSVSPIMLDHLELKLGPSSSGPTLFWTVGRPGGKGNNPQNPAVSTLVRKEIQMTSGRYAGRFYWPGTSDTVIFDDGTIAAATVSAFQAAFNTWHTKLEAAGMEPSVFGKLLDGVSAVQRFTVMPKIATQRRRLRR